MKLMLGIPTGGNVTQRFLQSLGAVAMPAQVTAFERHVVSGNFTPAQREVLLRRAIAWGADVLVMVDDDMVVPPDALELLLAALAADPQAGVVGALYYTRDGIRPVVADDWDSTDTTSASIPPFDNDVSSVDAVGFGCAALRVSTAGMLSRPYFGAHIYIEHEAARVRLCDEDFLYCERIRRAGFSVKLHAGVRCKHYDRETQREQPAQWESRAATVQKRMLTVDPGPVYRLVPFDDTVERKPERQETVSLGYLFVD